jgi:hypothetical protein
MKMNFGFKGCAIISTGATKWSLKVEPWLWCHNDNSVGAIDAWLAVGLYPGCFWSKDIIIAEFDGSVRLSSSCWVRNKSFAHMWVTYG